MAVIKRSTTRRANVLVETAIALPVIILFTLFVIEYGWWFLKAQQITNAARQGARVGARADATIGDVNAAIDASLAAVSPPVTGYSVNIAPDPAAIEPGELFTVTVSLDYGVFGLNFPLVIQPPSIAKEVTMAREGAD